MLATMNEKERKATLGKLLAMFAEAVNGAVRALEARRPKIAAGVVDRLANTVGDIDCLIDQGNYAPSVRHGAKLKVADLRSKLEGFSAAVQSGSGKEAKNIARWLKGLADELAELVGIE